MSVSLPPPDVLDRLARDNRAAPLTAAIIIMMVASTTALALRLVAQNKAKGRLWWDDWTLVTGWVISMAIAICGCLEFRFAAGRHLVTIISKYDDALVRIVTIQHLGYFITVLWGVALFFIKFSLLLLYQKIFNVDKQSGLRLGYRIILAYVIGVGISTTFVLIFNCQPISYFWTASYLLVGQQPPEMGACPNFVTKSIIMSTLNVVGDILVLLIPIVSVRKLQISYQKRWALTGIFILGTSCVVVSIVRIPYLLSATLSDDPTWNNSYSILFTCIEPLGGIFCASLICLGPFFRRRQRKSSTTYASGPDRKSLKGLKSWASSRLSSHDSGGDSTTLHESTERSGDSTMGGSTTEFNSLPKDSIRVQRDVIVEHVSTPLAHTVGSCTSPSPFVSPKDKI